MELLVHCPLCFTEEKLVDLEKQSHQPKSEQFKNDQGTIQIQVFSNSKTQHFSSSLKQLVHLQKQINN